MRLLVLGGTSYLSLHIARHALTRGHDVTCAARGESGPAPDGARFLALDRDEPGALDPLIGARFDAVVDVATGALGWVLEALEALADRTRHWTFVSSINVYSDTASPGQTVHAPLHEPVTSTRRYDPFAAETTIEIHGGLKVAGENAVRARLGDDHSLLVRPGIISGPGDVMDRFGYWAGRFARGGRAVVPDSPRQPVQHIDVRDLAAWIVTAAEDDLTGTFDAIGPGVELGEVFEPTARLVGAPDLELVPVAPEVLTGAGVAHWGGPASLPLWLPESMHGLVTHDPVPARDAGLVLRALGDTIRTALADERARGLDRPRRAGLTPEQERAVLDAADIEAGRSGPG
ncbi:NAD-dependent epimerase/dehydratase family protein [Saccharopolyspora gloriosae]|uniref:NAD-dependent epimerase/dehydratase family protein n=1 Tax=Saccharopolyspora gloriosae TaxID=455344 RepID=UPI001FB60148|nr:NAD-dependent epimerase/dehydratase family protein [Saccharopolyspora gloriosae]